MLAGLVFVSLRGPCMGESLSWALCVRAHGEQEQFLPD